MSSGCVFCKIVKGEIESAKIWEDDEFIAILDKNPNVKGMTLVLSKTHYPSDAFDLTEDVFSKLMLAAKKVAKLLDQKLDVKRTAMVMEGMGIDHVHIKLYPLSGLNQKFEEMWAKDKIFFDRYEGYITTQLGPEKSLAELKELAKQITS